MFSDTAKFPREMFSEEVQQAPKNAPPSTAPLSITLNSEDNMYSKLRDRNFGAVGTYLSKFAKDISAAFQVCGLMTTCMSLLEKLSLGLRFPGIGVLLIKV